MFESFEDIDVNDVFLDETFNNSQIDFVNGYPTSSDNSDKQCVNRNIRLPELHCQSKSNYTNGVTSGDEAAINFATRNISILTDVCTPRANKENDLTCSRPSPGPLRAKRERKFPGPAGLLPDSKSSRWSPLKLESFLEAETSCPNSTADELSSQGRCSGSVMDEEPWQRLLEDLGPDRSILDMVNIAIIKRKATARCFVGKKVPFLAAVLHHLDGSSPDPCIVLRDTTGEIYGTLHREVWDQFRGELMVGSVLVVRNVGLLSRGLSSRRHYLTITANNLVTIYSSSSEKSAKVNSYPSSKPDFKQIIDDWKTLGSPVQRLESSISKSSPSLFNSLFASPVNSTLVNSRNVNMCTNIAVENEVKLAGTPQHKRHNNFRMSSKIPNLPSRTTGKSMLPLIKHSQPKASLITNLHSSIKVNDNKNVFIFNPVIDKDNNSSSIFSQNQSYSGFKTHSNSNNTNCVTNTSPGRQIYLSQTSVLTAEEQSVVESVFDGVNADNLFDDDF